MASGTKTTAFGWMGMPIEMVAAAGCNTAVMTREKNISAAAASAAAGTNVLIMGTYYEPDATFLALCASAASVTLAPYTATNKYAAVPGVTATVPLDTLGATPATLPSVLLAGFVPPALDGLALAMLRRGETLPGVMPDDNALFRGMEQFANECDINVVALLAGVLARADGNNPDALAVHCRDWVRDGRVIVARDGFVGRAVSSTVGIPVMLGGQRTWLVAAPWSPVQPFVEAAVTDGASHGCLLGATIRWNPAAGTTAFSVRPVPGTAGTTDFMLAAPFIGGGPPGGRGACTATLLPVPTPGCTIEDLFPTPAE